MRANGIELNVNMLSASFTEKYEKGLLQLQEDASAVPGDSLSSSIRGQIACVKAFIDRVFGEGVYSSLQLDGDDLGVHLDLLERIVEETETQKERTLRRFDKYSPDRSARREK